MYNTTKYIDVLPKLIHNYNSSYHSGIKGIPNKVDSKTLARQNREQYNNAKNEEVVFNIGDQVRHVLNRKLFEKGSKSTFSKTIYTITDKNIHSYILNNGKTYKYYELLRVQTSNKISFKQGHEVKLQLLRNSKRRILLEGDLTRKASIRRTL